MIKHIRVIWKKYVHSLRAGMLTAIVASMLLGVAVYLVIHAAFTNWVDTVYNSQAEREERYGSYLADLESYVEKNAISSEDTAEITRWVRSNRNVYVFLYKDNLLFYDSIIENEKPDAPDTPDAPDGGTEDEPGDGTDEAPDDGEGGTEQPDDPTRPGTDSRPNGGITIDYPTREEIIQSAEKNGLVPLDFEDGTLFVSLVDFTEYIYYDIGNIASLAAAFITVAIVLMLYFHNITEKISRLAHDVSRVYEVDMNTQIRTGKGDDELSELTRNVERMRSTMLTSLQSEKEAISANAELITSMSHDIRTPLTVLLGYIDIMKTRESDEVMQEYLKASESTAMRLKELSDDLFRYFLVFGGDLEPELAEYDVQTLMDQLLTEHVLLLGERGYRVSCHLSKNLTPDMTVSTDAPKLMRVIDNLFSNIYKYADKEQPITVAAGLTVHGRLTVAIRNFTVTPSGEAESNRIGLKTCKKLCDALGAGFECTYGTQGGKETFTVTVELPTVKRSEGV